jgi:hypothetical protein
MSRPMSVGDKIGFTITMILWYGTGFAAFLFLFSVLVCVILGVDADTAERFIQEVGPSKDFIRKGVGGLFLVMLTMGGYYGLK